MATFLEWVEYQRKWLHQPIAVGKHPPFKLNVLFCTPLAGEQSGAMEACERYLDLFATRHCRTNCRGSTCVGRWGIAPSYNMAAWVPNISRYMRPLLWLCVAKLWVRHRSLRWLPHSIHQVHNSSTATGGKVGTEDTFTRDIKLTMSKDVFLSNVANKQNFIDMLSHYLQLAGCLTEHAEEDVDLLIEQTAVQYAATKNTVLVADDTDLVILLCYYADPDGFDLFMQCSTRGDNEEEPHLGYQSHPKWAGCWHLQQHPVHTCDIGVWHHIQTIWSRKRIVAEEIHLQCVVQR